MVVDWGEEIAAQGVRETRKKLVSVRKGVDGVENEFFSSDGGRN